MAHHAVPALIHTRAVRSSATNRGRQQSTNSEEARGSAIIEGTHNNDGTTNPETGAKTVSISQQSLWVLFFMTPFAIPMLIYGNLDSDVKRRICLGTTLAVFIMILVCLPLAAFNTRVNYHARHHDNDDRLLSEQRNVTVRRQLLSTATITAVAPPSRSRNYEYPTSGPPAYSAPSSDFIARHNVHFYPWYNGSGPSPSQSSEEGLRITSYPTDDPPPYYRVVFNLPLQPEVHNSRDPPRPAETPPPPYDKVQV